MRLLFATIEQTRGEHLSAMKYRCLSNLFILSHFTLIELKYVNFYTTVKHGK